MRTALSATIIRQLVIIFGIAHPLLVAIHIATGARVLPIWWAVELVTISYVVSLPFVVVERWTSGSDRRVTTNRHSVTCTVLTRDGWRALTANERSLSVRIRRRQEGKAATRADRAA